jgi:hypothetical protein
MPLKGNLESVFLNSIMQMLSSDEKSGILHVKNQQKEVKIYFQEGDVVFATGSQRENRLGYHLQSKGTISREKLNECLEAGQKEKKPLGRVLVEKGHITAEKLEKIVHDQIQEVIFDLLIWEKGDFEYKNAKPNLQDMTVIRLKVVAVLLEASRRIDEMSVLRKYIPNDEIVFRTVEADQDTTQLKLDATEWKVLWLIDGTRSVRQLIDENGFDEFHAYKTLYGLISAGLIETCQPRSAGEDTRISEHQQSWEYEEGPLKGPGPRSAGGR